MNWKRDSSIAFELVGGTSIDDAALMVARVMAADWRIGSARINWNGAVIVVDHKADHLTIAQQIRKKMAEPKKEMPAPSSASETIAGVLLCLLLVVLGLACALAVWLQKR